MTMLEKLWLSEDTHGRMKRKIDEVKKVIQEGEADMNHLTLFLNEASKQWERASHMINNHKQSIWSDGLFHKLMETVQESTDEDTLDTGLKEDVTPASVKYYVFPKRLLENWTRSTAEEKHTIATNVLNATQALEVGLNDTLSLLGLCLWKFGAEDYEAYNS